MRAIRVTAYGDYDQLRLEDIPQPELESGQVLIKMATAAINPVDHLFRLGRIPGPKPPLILGTEGAGVLAAGNASVPMGTRVMFSEGYRFPRGGTWQEYVVAFQEDIVPLPDNKSDQEAAALRTAYQTAHITLTIKAGFKADQTILATAVGSSVGNAVIQLARVQGAERIITTAGSTAKANLAREAGYANVIDLSQENLSDEVARLTGGEGVDVAVDCVGGAVTGQALRSLKRGGRLVIVGASGGEQATIQNLSHDLIGRDAHMLGFSLRNIPYNIRKQAFNDVFTLWSQGQVQPIVARLFPLEHVAEAQRYLMEGRPFGKVVLTF